MKLPIISYIYLVSTFIVVIIGALRFKRFDRGASIFFWFTVLMAITEGVTFTLSRFSINNHWVLPIYDLLEYILLILMFSAWQSDNKIKYALKLSVPIFIAIWAIAKFTFESFTGLSTYIHPLACLIFIVISIMTLFQFNRVNIPDNFKWSRYWIVSGILLFYASSIIFYVLVNEFALLNYYDALLVMNVHWSINLLANIIYSSGFILMKNE